MPLFRVGTAQQSRYQAIYFVSLLGSATLVLDRKNLKTQLCFYAQTRPSTLISHENGAFRKHSFTCRNLKTPIFRFRSAYSRYCCMEGGKSADPLKLMAESVDPLKKSTKSESSNCLPRQMMPARDTKRLHLLDSCLLCYSVLALRLTINEILM